MDIAGVNSNARHSYLAAAPGMDHATSPAAQDEFARLDRAESFRMLAAVAVGRLIFTSNALPAVLPVNFALADGLIVLRTAAAIVARKVHDTIVAFEADDLDPATFSGWSVTVTGRAALVTDLSIIARYQGPPLVPWIPGVRDQFVTITTELVEGLRVRGSGLTAVIAPVEGGCLARTATRTLHEP